MKKQVAVLLLITFMIFMGINGPALAVDGVIEINQARADAGGVTAGDTPGFPVTISVSGSYRLTGNLTNIPNADTHGIDITLGTDDVKIDLNGFAIIGPGGTGSGNGVSATARWRTTVINGVVRDMGANGISVGAQSRVSGVHVFSNGNRGISTTQTSIVTNNIAVDNGDDGIFAGVNSLVSGNNSDSNGDAGIFVSSSCTVIGNAVSNNTGFGLVLTSNNTGYKDNVMTNNNGGDANPQVSGGIEIGTNVCGLNTTCP